MENLHSSRTGIKQLISKKMQSFARIFQSFSLAEKMIFLIFLIVFIISGLSLLLKANAKLLVEVPKYGGTLKEGVIGSPRFINPVIALSDTDRDLTGLIYSGLTRINPDGEIIPDLAEKFSVSDDGREYTFIIREDAVFHDGKPVTTDDVTFTIFKTQDSIIKSPKRATWDGVLIEVINEKEIKFILNQPYSPFIFNTTLGILPKHIWGDITTDEFAFSKFNTEPIGSGPYKVKKIEKSSLGIAKSYSLEAFDKFTLNRPFIKKIIISFYKNETELIKALKDGDVESINSISVSGANEVKNLGKNVGSVPLPRIFGVFFNKSHAPILANKKVREALEIATPKEEIINEIFAGYGRVSEGPIPSSLIPYETLDSISTEEVVDNSNSKEEAIKILSDAGFEVNADGFMEKKTKDKTELLKLSISTANVPELIQVAEKIILAWREIGADVELKIFEPNDLNQNIIRPRKYDALLFGEIIGRDLDFYAFWHSSQRVDPGLNIADYANIDVDKLLEETRSTADPETKIKNYRLFDKAIREDIPAIFIYSPDFIYVLPKKLHGAIPANITTPADRFINIHSWFLETDTVWKIFKKD